MRGGSRLRVVGALKPAPGVAPGSLPYQGSALLLSYEGRAIAHAACIPDEGVAPPPPLCDRGVLLLDESGSIELVGFAPTTSGPPDQRATKLRHSSLFDESDTRSRTCTCRLTGHNRALRFLSFPGMDLTKAWISRRDGAPGGSAIGSGGNAPPSPPYQSGVLTSLLRAVADGALGNCTRNSTLRESRDPVSPGPQ